MAYYTAGTPATANTLARAENVAAELVTIVAAFDKIPEQLSLEQGRAVYALDTGVADAYLVALPATMAAYTTGLQILMKAVNVNTGASTVNVDGKGVKSIKRPNGDALEAGDIPAGGMVGLAYDGTNFQVARGTAGVLVAIVDGGTGATTAAAAFSALKQAATESATGVAEIATQAETDAGSDDTRYITPLKLAAADLGSLQSIQVFTGDGTYTKPAGLARARVEVIGAGGGSGGCAATSGGEAAGANGGGGGGSAIELLEASAIGGTETVTVGAGGTAGGAGGVGSIGGTSSFGALLSATGGGGGAAGLNFATDRPNADAPAGGVGSGGDVDSNGEAGGVGFASASGAVGMGGQGGNSRYGGGARVLLSSGSSTGETGTLFGGGASGSALGASQSAVVGSAGGAGIVIVWEYF